MLPQMNVNDNLCVVIHECIYVGYNFGNVEKKGEYL